ncbi:MAG: hypothetical protein ONB11_10410 [candidate division KSB1 bacterium]|nr:hypothetical protein [candidate division KSB1 bacterium]
MKTLNDCGVRYLVAGGYAVMYYTEPVFTKTIDIWVKPTPDNAKKVWQALAEFGAPLEQVSLADFCNKDLIYQIGVAPNRIDIMMDIPGVDFEKAWKKKSESHYGDVPIYILSLDDLIKAKTQAARDQDLLDLKNLKAIQAKR